MPTEAVSTNVRRVATAIIVGGAFLTLLTAAFVFDQMWFGPQRAAIKWDRDRAAASRAKP